MFGLQAGVLEETDEGYLFTYDPTYLQGADAVAVSLSLPLREAPYPSRMLHPFFDGLIPEGWLLDVVAETWKVSPRDRMGLLLTCCRDCIGAVSVRETREQ